MSLSELLENLPPVFQAALVGLSGLVALVTVASYFLPRLSAMVWGGENDFDGQIYKRWLGLGPILVFGFVLAAVVTHWIPERPWLGTWSVGRGLSVLALLISGVAMIIGSQLLLENTGLTNRRIAIVSHCLIILLEVAATGAMVAAGLIAVM